MKVFRVVLLSCAMLSLGSGIARAQSSTTPVATPNANTHCLDANGQVRLKSAMSSTAPTTTGAMSGNSGGDSANAPSSSSGTAESAPSLGAGGSSTFGPAGNGGEQSQSGTKMGAAGSGVPDTAPQQHATDLPKC
jgi:hypothetical protein